MRKKVLISIVVILLFIGFQYGNRIVKYSTVIFQLLFKNKIELKKTTNNINILVMGVGGGTHDGPDLTDTMLFVSVDQLKNKVHMVSIPRDLWIPDVKGRINIAYAVGEEKREGGGIVLSKAVVSKVMGQPIDYVAVINFNGFIKAVDLVGGLDVTVERSFDDYQYPVEEKKEDLCGNTLEEATQKIATLAATIVFPCRYEHLHFDEGDQHMDGATALKFVRSRYAIGPEGTDFARSKRQQKIIQSFKDKIFSLGILLNPITVTNLYSVLAESIDTDIQTSELDDFIKLAKQMQNASIHSYLLETEELENKKPGLLKNPPLEEFNGSWVLIPRTGNGNFSEIQKYITCIFANDSCPIK